MWGIIKHELVSNGEIFMSGQPRWTEQEGQILRDNSSKSLDELQELLPHRTKTAIRQRCYTLCIYNILWTNPEEIVGEQLECVKNNLHLSIVEIANKIGKSCTKVRETIDKYKLDKPRRNAKKWEDIEIEFLINNYQTMDTKDICINLDRTTDSIKQKASELNLKIQTRKEELTKEVMIDLYVNKNMLIKDIANLYSLNRDAVSWLLNKYNIPKKSQKEWSDIRGKRYSESVAWSGYEEIPYVYWKSLQKGAIDRNLEFKITIEYAWNLYVLQNRKCYFTNQIITFSRARRNTSDKTASLDRIDSSLGYIEGNVQWVHKTVNSMKMTLSNEELINVCTLIADNFRYK